MTEQTSIRWEKDADNIVTLTIDDPTQNANTMNELYGRSMLATVERLAKEKNDIAGVYVTSGKEMFFAGGDLNDLLKAKPEDAQKFQDGVTEIKRQLRVLETLGKPVVAGINGHALGGGLEIALAAHHRIAIDNPKTKIGLPEVKLGLLPGGGGVTRVVRMLGIQNALMSVLMEGKEFDPKGAKSAGLVSDLATDRADMEAKAKAWIKANPSAQQPWDVKGYKMPGGTPSTPALAMNLPAFPANLKKQLKGANYPAPQNIMFAAVEGAQVDFDNALKIEGRYFTELAVGLVAKNMIKAFFFDLQAINKGGSRPKGVPKYTAKKVGILGAGMMGAGIAYSCMRAGMDVVLKDVSLEGAEKGKAYSANLLDKSVSKGRMTKEKRDEQLARIKPTATAADLAGCDLVIEAVFESQELKHKVFQEIEGVVAKDCLLASNTSSLPITGLAEGVKDQPNFIGLHFFSPVDKMPLVEIIRGQKTSDEALAKAIDVVLQIKKVPIVVNDARGFYTTRVIGTQINEGIGMLAEGVHPLSIEQAAAQAGYPVGPLAIMDELTLTLPRKLREETKKAIEAAGGKYTPSASDAVVDTLIDKFDRKGKSTGKGFYDYPQGGKKAIAAEVVSEFWKPGTELPMEDMKERMLFIEAIETVKCWEENVIRNVADANIGSIMGIGFPAWTGGVIQYMNNYPGGMKAFVARSRELAKKYGERFNPPKLLVEKAEKGELFE
ncbi:MAG: 3-hydroxyacyl-CoA dehydrogenase NAD-binding domain-containing protein [Gammaproteobacteria bacterium]